MSAKREVNVHNKPWFEEHWSTLHIIIRIIHLWLLSQCEMNKCEKVQKRWLKKWLYLNNFNINRPIWTFFALHSAFYEYCNLSDTSVSQNSSSHPRKNPVNVIGSLPWWTVMIGVPLNEFRLIYSRLSERIYHMITFQIDALLTALAAYLITHHFLKQSKPIPFLFDGDDAKYSFAKSWTASCSELLLSLPSQINTLSQVSKMKTK